MFTPFGRKGGWRARGHRANAAITLLNSLLSVHYEIIKFISLLKKRLQPL